MREECPGLFPGRSYQWQENHVSPKGTESLCHLQSKWELLSGKGEVASTQVLSTKRLEKNPRGGAQGGAYKADSLQKTRVSMGSRFPTVVSIPVTISVFFGHVAFILLSKAYFVGCVSFTIILSSVISVIYCPSVFIWVSLFYIFSHHCLTFQSFTFWVTQICPYFHIYFSICPCSPNTFRSQNLSFLFWKYVSEYDLFLFPTWSLLV